MDKTKILVVDDESRMRKLVKDFLVRQGYTVLEAADGMEARDYFYEDKDIDYQSYMELNECINNNLKEVCRIVKNS